MDFAVSDLEVLAGLLAVGIAWQFFFLLCMAPFAVWRGLTKTFEE